jgi:hypothetical protein
VPLALSSLLPQVRFAMTCTRRKNSLYKIGCAPVEDCGSLPGWDYIKEIFRKQHPTEEERERINWAKAVSGLGDNFNPLAEPKLEEMNFNERWQSFLADNVRAR